MSLLSEFLVGVFNIFQLKNHIGNIFKLMERSIKVVESTFLNFHRGVLDCKDWNVFN
jgi:hypothetical protein